MLITIEDKLPTFTVFVDKAFLAAAINEKHRVARTHTNAAVARRFLVTPLRYDLNLHTNSTICRIV